MGKKNVTQFFPCMFYVTLTISLRNEQNKYESYENKIQPLICKYEQPRSKYQELTFAWGGGGR